MILGKLQDCATDVK